MWRIAWLLWLRNKYVSKARPPWYLPGDYTVDKKPSPSFIEPDAAPAAAITPWPLPFVLMSFCVHVLLFSFFDRPSAQS